MLRFEPPPPDRRTDSHGNVSRQGIKVDSSFGTHTTAILMIILSVSVLAASPLCRADMVASPSRTAPPFPHGHCGLSPAGRSVLTLTPVASTRNGNVALFL